MSMLDKLMEKKKKEAKPLDPMYASSKMSMLQALKDEMSGMMKGDLEHKGMKKVEVAAPDSEGLKEGLDKAKEVVGHEGEEESPEHEASESTEEESAEGEANPSEEVEELAQDASSEELDEMIKKLEELKAKKAMGV